MTDREYGPEDFDLWLDYDRTGHLRLHRATVKPAKRRMAVFCRCPQCGAEVGPWFMTTREKSCHNCGFIVDRSDV